MRNKELTASRIFMVRLTISNIGVYLHVYSDMYLIVLVKIYMNLALTSKDLEKTYNAASLQQAPIGQHKTRCYRVDNVHRHQVLIMVNILCFKTK